MRIPKSTFSSRVAAADRLNISLNIGDILFTHGVFEYVEPSPPIGFQDIWRKSAVIGEGNEPAIAERLSTRLALFHVSLHIGGMRTIVN